MHIYANIPRHVIVRLPHPPRSRNSQSQETFLAPSADKQTCNFDTEWSNLHHQKAIGLSGPKMDLCGTPVNRPKNELEEFIAVLYFLPVR